MKKGNLIYLLSLIIITTSAIFAQGVTTSGLDGFVTDTDGNELVGANVIVVHEQDVIAEKIIREV